MKDNKATAARIHEGTATRGGDAAELEELGRVNLGADEDGRPVGSSPAHLSTGVDAHEPGGPQAPHLQTP
jgi:hypothetical protein